MEHHASGTLRERVGESLRTNKLAVLLELLVVFVPMQALLMISSRVENDFIPLGGDTVLIGGPVAWLGAVMGFVLAWTALRMRGSGWRDLGMSRPKRPVVTVLLAIAVAVVITILLTVVAQLVSLFFPNAEPPDLSRFTPLRGNPVNLLINLVAVWITAGFLEEMLWRGFLMNRLADLGGRTKPAWALALPISAIVFGCVHFYQGPSGMVLTGIAGLLVGGAYLLVKRNLWVVILAHGLIDTLSYVGMFLDAS